MIIELNKQYTLIDNKGYNTNIIWTIESIHETIIRPEEQVSYIHSPIQTLSVVSRQPIELTSIIVVNKHLNLEYEISLEEFINNFTEYS